MPPNGYYPCQDGHVFIATLMPGLWDKLVDLVGDPRLADAGLAGCGLPQRAPGTGGPDSAGVYGAL